MADFTSKHNLKASLHFLSSSQCTKLARHGNEQLDTTILESQKQNQKPLTYEIWKTQIKSKKRDFKASMECKTVLSYINAKTLLMGAVPSV